MNTPKRINILFVCMGNICRSPTAEGVFHKLLEDSQLTQQFDIDSAGTHAYHIGESPDSRSQMAIMRRGIDISGLRARKVTHNDYEKFDYILAMDASNYQILQNECPKSYQHKVKLFLEFAPELQETDLPDPYYGGHNGFEHVLDLCEAASIGLLNDIRQKVLAAG